MTLEAKNSSVLSKNFRYKLGCNSFFPPPKSLLVICILLVLWSPCSYSFSFDCKQAENLDVGCPVVKKQNRERTLCLSGHREITTQLCLKNNELSGHRKTSTIFSHFLFGLIFFVGRILQTKAPAPPWFLNVPLECGLLKKDDNDNNKDIFSSGS